MLIVKGNGTVPLPAEDVRALNIVDKVSWIGNKAFDDADMFNSDLVVRQMHAPAERVYQGNKAHGRSTVVQGHVDAIGITAIMIDSMGLPIDCKHQLPALVAADLSNRDSLVSLD